MSNIDYFIQDFYKNSKGWLENNDYEKWDMSLFTNLREVYYYIKKNDPMNIYLDQLRDICNGYILFCHKK